MEPTPFLFQENQPGEALVPLKETKRIFDEAWLQEFLRQQPDVLPTGAIEPVFSPLIPIGREVPTTSGYIDNLFISKHGYPVLVETKLWRNPEAKREVLAQAIDYGNCLAQWTFSRLDEATREYTKKYEKSAVGLIEWIEQRSGPIEGGRIALENTISRNLRLGRFLILIVGDRIRNEVVEILRYANRFPHLAVNVALVELRCYHLDKEHEWPLLIVPSLIAQTEIVERSIVEVTLSPDVPFQIKVKQEVSSTSKKKGTRISLSEQAYWDTLKSKAPDRYSCVQEIIERFKSLDMIEIEPKESSMAVYVLLPESGQRITLFFIRTDGTIECWHTTIADQLSRSGRDPSLAGIYTENLRQVLKKRTKKLSIYDVATQIDLNEFYRKVDGFIEQITNAEPSQ